MALSGGGNASGGWSLVFTDDVTAGRRSRTNCEVCRVILSAQSQLNVSKLCRQHFTVQMDNDPKRTAKATQEFLTAKKLDILQ